MGCLGHQCVLFSFPYVRPINLCTRIIANPAKLVLPFCHSLFFRNSHILALDSATIRDYIGVIGPQICLSGLGFALAMEAYIIAYDLFSWLCITPCFVFGEKFGNSILLPSDPYVWIQGNYQFGFSICTLLYLGRRFTLLFVAVAVALLRSHAHASSVSMK